MKRLFFSWWKRDVLPRYSIEQLFPEPIRTTRSPNLIVSVWLHRTESNLQPQARLTIPSHTHAELGATRNKPVWSHQPNVFFLKWTGRRAAHYIKKKGVWQASTKERAQNKAQSLYCHKKEIGRLQRKEQKQNPARRNEKNRVWTKPRVPSSAWRPPPSSSSLGL